MKPANHTLFFPIYYKLLQHKEKFFIAEKLQQQIPLPIKSDKIKKINSKVGLIKESPSKSVADCSSENEGPLT